MESAPPWRNTVTRMRPGACVAAFAIPSSNSCSFPTP